MCAVSEMDKYRFIKILEKHLDQQISDVYLHAGRWWAHTGYGVVEVNELLREGRYSVAAQAVESLNELEDTFEEPIVEKRRKNKMPGFAIAVCILFLGGIVNYFTNREEPLILSTIAFIYLVYNIWTY